MKPTNNILDQWILARLNQLVAQVTYGLETYELDKAARPIADFVDDLSTWYLRRSREKIKSEGGETLRLVLLELSKVMAPFMPFIAEDIYKRAGGELESAHLESWPSFAKASEGQAQIIGDMEKTRELVEKALAARDTEKIKVRQPLATLKTKIKLSDEFLELVREEINVKKVEFDEKLESDVWLDTTITPELKEEGDLRELVRDLQDQRKKLGLKPGEPATLKVQPEFKHLLSKYEAHLKKTASATNFEFE